MVPTDSFDRETGIDMLNVNGGISDGAQYAIRKLLWALIIAVVLEIAWFNFPFWESLTFGPEQQVELNTGSGLTETSAGTYRIDNVDQAYFEFDAGGVHVDNIKFDLSVPGWGPNSWRDALGPFITMRVSATDSSSTAFIDLPSFTYCQGLSDSHWRRLHLSGGSDAVRIYLSGYEGMEVRVDSVSINAVRPFNVIPLRLVALVAVALAFHALRPASPLHKRRLAARSAGVKVAIALLVVFELVAVVGISRLSGVSGSAETDNPQASGTAVLDFNQYNYVADALLQGRVSLDLPVSSSLSKMENPYDAAARNSVLAEAGETYYMDYAYYDGEYYSYFGVLPALTMFAPYKALTGHDLRTDRAVSALCIGYVLTANALLLALSRRYAPSISLGLFLWASLSFVTCSGLLYLAFLPQLYSIPILMGLSCVFIGLTCWLFSEKAEGGSYRKALLALGGLFVALSLACRPQYVLAALLAFPIFWEGITRHRQFFSIRGAGNTAAVIVPFLLVALPVMWYNALRFGSPFDFGAAYNLTGSDMTSRGIVAARSLPAVFQYLFQPFSVNARYPYVYGVNMAVDYQGYWFYEPFLGGFFWFAPIAATIFFAPRWFKRHRGSIRILVASLLVIAFVILFADYQIASITTRYFNDFSWLVLISTWLMLWSEDHALSTKTLLLQVLYVAIIAGIILNVWCLLSPDRYGSLASTCPTLYYGIASLFNLV